MSSSKRYVIVTPFTKADVLAGICKIQGLDVWIVPSKQGAMVVHDLPVPVFDDWDISELLGGSAKPAEDEQSEEPAADTSTLSADDHEGVAKALARLSRAGVILLTSELGEDVGHEEGVSGLVTALVYDSNGTASDTPAGLIVATGEDILEDLLLGHKDPEKVAGAIRSGEIDTTAIERLAERGPDTPLPPRRPRRFFGKDSS